MPNWYRVTSRPRIRVGAISAMYIGARIEAAPMPTPPSTRQTTNWLNE